MRKILLLSFIAIFGLDLEAQQNAFSRVYYDSSAWSTLTASGVTQSVDGGYILIENNGTILKIDSAGTLIWTKTFSYVQNSYPSIALNGIINTSDSNFITFGRVYDSVQMVTHAYFMKISDMGNVLWNRVISVPGSSLNTLSLRKTNDSGYIACGTCSGTTSNMFVTKLANSGSLLWTTLLSGGNNYNEASSVIQTPDSGYVLVGYSQNQSPNYLIPFMARISKTGSLLWTKKYTASSGSVCMAKDIILVNNGYLVFMEVSQNVAVMKTDLNGNLLWNVVHNLQAWSGTMVPPRIIPTSDSNYVLCTGWCGGSHFTKVDTSGNMLWNQMVYLGNGQAIESKDKGFLILGDGPLCGVKASSTLAPQLGAIKTDSAGNSFCGSPWVMPPVADALFSTTATFTATAGSVSNAIIPIVASRFFKTDTGCVSFMGGVTENSKELDFSVLPVPATDYFIIARHDVGPAQIQLFDLTGKIIMEMNNEAHELHVSTKGLTPGMYLLRLQAGHKTVTRKLIIQP